MLAICEPRAASDTLLGVSSSLRGSTEQ